MYRKYEYYVIGECNGRLCVCISIVCWYNTLLFILLSPGEVSIVLSSGEEESVCFSQPQGGSQSSQPRDAHSPGSRQSSSRQDSVRGEPGQPKKKKISLQVLFKGAK